MNNLAQKSCGPCRGEVPPLTGGALQEFVSDLVGDWQVVDGHRLEKTFQFSDFVGALGFTNNVGVLAEAQQHHPDIYLAWGKVKVTLWTHKIGGLSENDFIMAAKIDSL